MFSYQRLRNAGLLALTLFFIALGATIYPVNAQVPTTSLTVEERVNIALAQAQVEAGATQLAAALSVQIEDDELRLGTGFLQFANAVENLGQFWYQYGLRSQGPLTGIFPILRLPVPDNPTTAPMTNAQARQVLEQFEADILLAEDTLAQLADDTVKLGVNLGKAYLDFDGDGQGSDPEALWRIYGDLNRRALITEAQAANFRIALDAGDVQWLRGYCHLLAAVLDFYLAHDDSLLFDHTAHLFFQNPEVPYAFLREQPSEEFFGEAFLDAIALVHLINLPLIDRDRPALALSHLQQVTALSRQTWDFYLQETDDDHEWIPNPNQTGVIPGMPVTPEMIDQWLAFLDEVDAILAGDRLLPFWRGTEPVGVNLPRIFTEPQTFDAVRWVQGTAATPYLETGTLTNPDFWWQLMEAFDGRFLFFALWFN
ncbi:MAG: hypothetical protein ACFB0G_03520 [Leptolyngbyaceae cyanobacterium]